MGSERFRIDCGPKRESVARYSSRYAADYVIAIAMKLTLETEQEADGRWIAEVAILPGVLCYGTDRDEAVTKVQALALRVIAERLEHREAPAEYLNVTFLAA